MDRWRNLTRYQKGILLLLAAMAVIFGVVYFVVSSRVGYLYMDEVLVPSQENENTVYSGTIEGQDCRFVVSGDGTVAFYVGEKVYGPYTVAEDPDAIPEDDSFSDLMTGVEVRETGKIIFRGGVLKIGGTDPYWMLVNEDGSNPSVSFIVTMHDGTMVDEDGYVIDEMEPSVSNILELLHGPELTSKGEWLAWGFGVLLSLVTAVSILFADEIFRWNLSFRIRDVDRAEPSDWALVDRNIGWAIGPAGALVIYLVGLQ